MYQVREYLAKNWDELIIKDDDETDSDSEDLQK